MFLFEFRRFSFALHFHYVGIVDIVMTFDTFYYSLMVITMTVALPSETRGQDDLQRGFYVLFGGNFTISVNQTFKKSFTEGFSSLNKSSMVSNTSMTEQKFAS